MKLNTIISASLSKNPVLHDFNNEDTAVISIHVSKSERRIEIDYHDDGKGLTEEQRTQIFEAFFSRNEALGK